MGETSDDAWETVDLIDRFERIPGSHFTPAPLSLVPLGALRGGDFFDVDMF
ncbi:MAG: hypothetical protein ACE5Z5_12905 [Candidatus Bathyarchaeia archaeon]